ncbi:selection and upkeep of intraepithelial T-cells protein 1-like isoform X1 [Chaetodon trifascialis]|uniref:selection and upkeep of intraepithelial T-cells protein 1-like isoform X1 n=1 Tax=Chaetodon trifascialis TaxID=109706 RepID=UPI0039937ADB
MRPAGLSLFCCALVPLFSSVAPPASGMPLQTSSPGRVFAVVGKDVVLPCRLTASVDTSRVMAVEWSRVDGPSPLTLHVVRDGEELVKEKAPQYLRRTAIMEDGSLKLLGVQRQDDGVYRCVLLRGSSVRGQALVSLIVAQVSEVNLSVRRTSANELFVHCESSGWNPEPTLSLLDSRGNVLAARVESSVRPDGLFSVQTLVDVATAEGNGTLICRVEIPEASLASEGAISVIDEFDSLQTGLGRDTLLVVALVLTSVFALAAIVPVWGVVKQRFFALQTPKGPMVSLCVSEYGDINLVDTKGASEDTARPNNVSSRGTEASNELASRDLSEMLKYKEAIKSVGKKLHVHPALIAAIISRQSQAGTKLSPTGFGMTDPNCFGLMQINRHYHAVKGNPFSEEHLDQGVTFLIQLIKTMTRMKRDWSKEQQLKGALACYIAGEERVIPLSYEELDSVTPNRDFANDVVARAKWFINNGF